MELREAAWSDLDELMAFYQEMSRVLDKKDFLPQGNRGGFPAREMVREAIGAHGQFVGVEDGRIVAAYLLNHRCDSAYRTVTWGVDAPPEEVLILHALRVLPQYGGRGYARRLVEHAIQTARARGAAGAAPGCGPGQRPAGAALPLLRLSAGRDGDHLL